MRTRNRMEFNHFNFVVAHIRQLKIFDFIFDVESLVISISTVIVTHSQSLRFSSWRHSVQFFSVQIHSIPFFSKKWNERTNKEKHEKSQMRIVTKMKRKTERKEVHVEHMRKWQTMRASVTQLKYLPCVAFIAFYVFFFFFLSSLPLSSRWPSSSSHSVVIVDRVFIADAVAVVVVVKHTFLHIKNKNIPSFVSREIDRRCASSHCLRYRTLCRMNSISFYAFLFPFLWNRILFRFRQRRRTMKTAKLSTRQTMSCGAFLFWSISMWNSQSDKSNSSITLKLITIICRRRDLHSDWKRTG